MAWDVTFPSLIRAEKGFKYFTAENVFGKIEAHHNQLNRVKINQDLTELQEQVAKNNELALQVQSKGKEKATQHTKNNMTSDNDSDEQDDEQKAFFIKNFRRIMRKSNFQNFGKNKHESRRRSKKPCFGCKKIGHFIADCPEDKKKTKITKRAHPRRVSQDRRSKLVKLILVKNGIQMNKATLTMKMLQPWHSRPLLLINQAYLKISPMMKIKAQSCALWQRT
jgi:hypothetical protein